MSLDDVLGRLQTSNKRICRNKNIQRQEIAIDAHQKKHDASRTGKENDGVA